MSSVWVFSRGLRRGVDKRYLIVLGIAAVILCTHSFNQKLSKVSRRDDSHRQNYNASRYMEGYDEEGMESRPVLRFIDHPEVTLNLSMSDAERMRAFYKYLETPDVECLDVVRLGNQADGGWNMCLAPPFKTKKNCLVYSFGINNDWSFDDAMAHTYGCTVRSFDPSMEKISNKHSELVWFYELGLAGKNYVNHLKWHLKTMGTILQSLEDDEEEIDYLKMDIEGSEWAALETMMEEGVLDDIKQIGLELHFRMDGNSYFEYWKILKALEDSGFKKWDVEHNTYRLYDGDAGGYKKFCCSNLWLLNTKFIDGSRDIIDDDPLLEDDAVADDEAPAFVTADMSDVEAEDTFFRELNNLTFDCVLSLLEGHADLQDWDLCDTPPFAIKSPCLVYMFETNSMSNFMGAVERQLECQFLKMNYNWRREVGDELRLPVYEYGSGWILRALHKYTTPAPFDLTTFMGDHKHAGKTIDVLRLDVLEDAWELLPHLIQNKDFINIKQLILRVYLPERKKQQSTTDDYIGFQNILTSLGGQGFLKWKSHPCKFSQYFSEVSGRWRSWCHELIYVNKRYTRQYSRGAKSRTSRV